MSVQTTVAVSPADFLLGRTLAVDADVRIELERVVPLDDGLAPYLRIESEDPALVTDLLAAESDVTEVDPVRRGDGEWLVRVRWAADDCDLRATLVETAAACVEAVAVRGTWHLTLRFPTHGHLTDCYRRCTDRGVRLRVERVREAAGDRGRGDTRGLTDRQREALSTALEAGYFAVPRAATLEEVAASLDISDTAASQRIRRGTRNLLASVLAAPSERAE